MILENSKCPTNLKLSQHESKTNDHVIREEMDIKRVFQCLVFFMYL
jgi:hypothetical protein